MKKKILLTLMVITIGLILFGTISVSAETEGIYTYTVSNGEATIIDCDNSASGEIIIPSTIEGIPVTSIDDYAYEYCSSLESITIPDRVTNIGNYAFVGCDDITSVTIGDSVTAIGRYAFEGCSSLESITIPDSVTSIGDFAFYDCISLTKVTIAKNNKN